MKDLSETIPQGAVLHILTGNGRESQSIIERAMLNLDCGIKGPVRPASFLRQACGWKLSIKDYTKLFILQYQDRFNEQQLADMLGISRKSLWEKRKKWGLRKERRGFLNE